MNPRSRIWITGLTLASFAVLPSQSHAQNTSYGAGAGTSGSFNSNFGVQAGTDLTTGSDNSNFGFNSGASMQVGTRNSNFGRNAGFSMYGGNNNSNFGYKAGSLTSNGFHNVFVGSEAGRNNTTGNYNTALGSGSGGNLTTGQNNVLFGVAAGGGFNGESGGITSGVGIVCLGANTARHAPSVIDYSVVLGYGAARDYSFPAGKSLFLVNNQAQMSNPLLYGTFANNVDHYSSSSAVATGAKAQLAINTPVIEQGMTLTVNGPTYIGDFSPAGINNAFVKDSLLKGYYLWVEKGIVSENYAIAKVTGWSDFVFDADYKLQPLLTVDSFIKQNKHLPGLAPEKEIVRSGYTVHDMNKTFMMKIEELTLYAIEQQKEIERLKKEQFLDKAALKQEILEELKQSFSGN